ncbi:MAG: hypothetical protein AB1630_01765 [bacterium]
MIKLARKHQRKGTGSNINMLKKRTARRKWCDLSDVLSIPWAVVGAVGSRLYMPERATQDLDIAILARDREIVREQLKSNGFKYQGELTISGSSWLSYKGESIDVIELDESYEDAVSLAQNNRDLQGLPIMPLEYLILLKYKSGRVQDIADISRMLGQAGDEKINDVRELFKALLPQEIKDLESLLELGKLELKK